jgi:hypothetical protein
MDTVDAYRCAKLMNDRYGREAPIYAAMRADELDAAGDEAGRQAWMTIIAALDELSRVEKHSSERLQ